jgi:DNA polymerase-3 subunit gamma/tau
MQRIVKAEEIKADKQALLEIAKIADGSFRDATKILEEVSVFAGRKIITADLVNEKFNTLGISESLASMLEALAKKDTKKGLLICKELTKQGMDFKFFIEQLINGLHLMLLQEVGVEKKEKEVPFTLSEIEKLFEILTTSYQEMKTTVLMQMPLELAILEWGEKKDNASSSEESLGIRAVGSPSSATTPQAVVLSSPADGLLSTGDLKEGLFHPDANLKLSFYNKLIDRVKLQNHLVAGLMRGCLAQEVVDGKLNIITKSKFHKEKLEEAKTRQLLEECAEKILGKSINIQILLQGGDK